jgi:hypothetical protein
LSDAAVNAWAADVPAGKETGLYAWRRANVAEVNTLARQWMAESGRQGPDPVSADSQSVGETAWQGAPSRSYHL